ncbi:LysE family translocator [Corynebacterium cystitidis]|uniref:LysE family translocator n=1 Tax=Corynebacterium cystitidis TaxID=35757 RepID=UPI00211F3EB5|nr:LysE family translocator [Corynebacterium cystitidis]
MTFASYLAMIGVWLAAIASPGPDLFQIIRIGTKSRANAVACALGIMVGNTFWILASLLGLSALIQTFPDILGALQLIGGAYLLWMGASSIRGGLQSRSATNTRVLRGPGMSSSRALRLGLTTNLSNPKAVLFFGAVFAQFVRPGMGWEWMVIIAATLIVTGVAWFVGFALLIHVIARPLERYGWLADVVVGVLFVALGIWMVVDGMAELIM